MVSVYGECWVNVGVKGCPKIDKKNKIFCQVTLQIIMCDNIQLCIRLFENKLKLKLYLTKLRLNGLTQWQQVELLNIHELLIGQYKKDAS